MLCDILTKPRAVISQKLNVQSKLLVLNARIFIIQRLFLKRLQKLLYIRMSGGVTVKNNIEYKRSFSVA